MTMYIIEGKKQKLVRTKKAYATSKFIYCSVKW